MKTEPTDDLNEDFPSEKTAANLPLIQAIADIIQHPLRPAPIRPHDPFGGLMAFKKDTAKYQLEGQQLVGLNLAACDVDDDKWQKINDLDGFDFAQLKALNLSDNRLTMFEPPEEMGELERLNLGENQIEEFPISEGLGNLEDLRLDGNPLENIPPEVIKRGRQAVLRFLKEVKFDLDVELGFPLRTAGSSAPTKLLEAKLLIIGAGGTGKTSLLTKLKNAENALPAPDETTVGISITVEPLRYQIEGETCTLNAWDFGGQDIYHPTHQLFLTKRSVYVLLQDSREQRTDFDYWLAAQQLLAGDSPLLLLQNLKDRSRCNVPYNDLRSRYPNIQAYFELDLSEVRTGHEEFLKLEKRLKSELSNLPHVGSIWPSVRLRIRQTLEKEALTRDYLDLDEYRDICRAANYNDPASQDDLIAILHDLGVVLHFAGDRQLEDLVIIRPQWATDAIYAILDHTKKHDEKRGHFNWSDLKMVWQDKKYKGKFNELLRLMERFELVYELPKKDGTYIAPMLLPEQKPDFVFDPEDFLQMRYEYDFLPKGILSRLIVRMHEDIENQEFVWKRGVIFHFKNTRALVTEVYNGRQIILSAYGPEVGTMLEMICKEMDSINDTFRFGGSLDVKKKVPCNCAECGLTKNKQYFFDFDILETWLRKNGREAKIQCHYSGTSVSIEGLLSRIMAPKHGL